MNPVIPAPVSVPLPAPVWLLQLLLVLTFVFHLVLMNLLAGGGVLLALSNYLGRRDARHRELARRAARVMPPVVAFTITFGVAPLLFLQLLYGQLFYTSSVLMAWAWLVVILLVMLGYYGIYWFSLQQEVLGTRALRVIVVTALLFVGIMVIFVQNLSLMQQPQDFYARFLAGTVGTYMGSYDARVLVRFLHFLVAALAVAGLGLALLAGAWRGEDSDLAAWARRYGVRWFMVGTGVQFLVGLWFLFSIPYEIRASFLGADRLATGVLVVAVVLAILALAAAPKSLPASAAAIVGTIGLMAVIRHLVRVALLRPYFDPRALPVESQWFVFGLFAVLLVAGLATVGWMLYVFFRPATPGLTSG